MGPYDSADDASAAYQQAVESWSLETGWSDWPRKKGFIGIPFPEKADE
jgi:hypothetical protein